MNIALAHRADLETLRLRAGICMCAQALRTDGWPLVLDLFNLLSLTAHQHRRCQTCATHLIFTDQVMTLNLVLESLQHEQAVLHSVCAWLLSSALLIINSLWELLQLLRLKAIEVAASASAVRCSCNGAVPDAAGCAMSDWGHKAAKVCC